MPKTISLCTDGRGCKYSLKAKRNCVGSIQDQPHDHIIDSIGSLIGCDLYKEKAEITLKERIKILIHKYELCTINGMDIIKSGKAMEARALLRDIVDEAISLKEIIDINRRTTCTSDMMMGTHDIYEKLGISQKVQE